MSDETPQPAPRKQRMGQTARPAIQEDTVAVSAAPAPTPSAPTPAAQPVRRTRMGAPAAAAAASETVTSNGVTHAPASAVGAPAIRQRMGAAPAAAPVIPVVEAEPASSAPAAAPRSRMGAAAPATASTAQPATSHVAVAVSEPEATQSSRNPWVRRIVLIVGVLVLAIAAVLAAKWLRTLPDVQGFIATYPGHSELPESAPTGLPAWMGWQHFLNMFFIVLIVRTGLQVRNEKKAPAYWKANENSFFSPKGATPKKVSLTQWVHQSLDALWMLNGVVFVILLFVTGQWMKIVPLSWDIIPNALSAGLQYVSLVWPHENGWIHYNALQVIAYFLTVFVAAPLAVLSGVRFSTWWPDQNAKLSKLYPVEWARAIHFPVMLYFVGFTIVHVFLVFFTGAMRNLNHMYTSRDVVDGWGIAVFAASLLVIAAGWWLTKPIFMRPLAARTGTLSK